MSERQLQKSVCDYLSRALPYDVFWTAIPGGDRGVTLAPGYVSGTPDLLLIVDGSPYFIELKTKTGRVSDSQVRTHMRLVDAGAKVSICRSVEEVERFLRAYHVPLKGRIAA